MLHFAMMDAKKEHEELFVKWIEYSKGNSSYFSKDDHVNQGILGSPQGGEHSQV